jgi:hypothetical protein
VLNTCYGVLLDLGRRIGVSIWLVLNLR